MKASATLFAVCLVACQDLTMGGDMKPAGPGSDDPHDPADDPRDNPFLADINNSWEGPSTQGITGFNFAASPSGKISSAVIRGNAGIGIQLDGLFYDHMVHFIAIQDGNVAAFDGVFVDIQMMVLTVEPTQASVSRGCSTLGGPCM
jgi:hypothetical protein